MATADLPSSSKKPTYARTDDLPTRRDPNDLRGSMAEQARTQWAEEIKLRAFKGRAGVNLGYSTTTTSSLSAPSLPSSRRPLGPSRTEPHLSFGPSPTASAPWQSSRDILDSVYAVPRVKRADELRPMWETGSQDGAAARAVEGEDSGFFGAPGMDVERDQDEGDGFDLDEAFGPAKEGLSFGLLGRQAEAEESQGSNSTTRTVTQRLKRAFEEEPAEEADGQDDEEMAPTDVEDEAEDQPGPLGSALRGAAAQRRTAGLRKGWGKTQSLPASAFESMVDF
ncbi:hypothetical protein NBRC10513v2_001770 [Rhodotorula toruloides]|uniref:Putative membrane protein n=1 Tax=Rhodotorula toruloides TaxID=5286 RepID=A0A2T0A7A0_RHOTO|nr:putative membrane protein [Rhodotorula toruloides]